MFGAYQAGAWRVLARRFRPDLVIGASVGALNAWAVAAFADPEDLISSWLDEAVAETCRLRFPPLPGRCLFDARGLQRRVRRLWESWRPQAEVGVVATDLLRLRPRLFRNSEIGWEHLMASCAVLFCYPQVRIGGRLYSDGGLLEALPLWAAAEMGARRIVAVNALPVMPSRAVRGFVRGVRAMTPRLPERGAVEATLIEPPGPLGTLHEAVFWQRSAIRRWIEAGERDAAAVTLPA
jgi:NTE family protein